MNIFTYKSNKYLKLKGHNFVVLNLFYLNNKLAYLQCISQNKDRILKEYLDKKTYELIRTKHEGQIIYTIYNKDYFKYRKLKNVGNLVFIAPTIDGCIHLAALFFYNTYADKSKKGVDLDFIKELLIKQKDGNGVYGRYVEEIGNSVEDGQFKAINFQGQNWRAEYFFKTIG